MLFRKFAIFAVVASLLLGCNYYSINYEDRKNISILINEIYQNAINNNNELSLEELSDLDITKSAESIMKTIIKAKINKNYKRRMNLTDNKNIINFDYHWDEKKVYFQIYIEKNENGEWKAIRILNCR